MTTRIHTDIGELIAFFYAEFMALYDDEELASTATAAVINDLLLSDTPSRGRRIAA